MQLEPGHCERAVRCSLEALACATILLALLGGAVAAVRLGTDFAQLLAHVEVVLPG